jgi:formylglycine-generating enzyme required for sulfatase activity
VAASTRPLPARLALSAALALGCEPANVATPEPEPVRTETRSAPTPEAPATEPALDPGVAPCAGDMVLVEGSFCPETEQVCLKHDPEYVADPTASERCLEYAEPAVCRSPKRTLLRFCIDRYEWPNREGQLPRVLVDFREARSLCESAGKRLCDESEWLFACEGEDMRPYVYGYRRDPAQCVIDRPYVERSALLQRYDDCLADAECSKLFRKLDQREPAGSSKTCVSPFGAFDMNGNVNEWVNLPGESPPKRSGLKGGWWGPVRNRCRPTVRFHDENDWGYEIGLRCCDDAVP